MTDLNDPAAWDAAAAEAFGGAPERVLNQEEIDSLLGFELNDAHRAWADAEAAGKVLLRLVDRMPKLADEWREHVEALRAKGELP